MSFNRESSARRQLTGDASSAKFAKWREQASLQVLADRNISFAAKAVYHFLLWRMNRESGGWTLLLKTIAAGTGMSPRYARESLTKLEAHGYIKRVPHRGHSNFYIVAGWSNNFSTAEPLFRGGGTVVPPSNGTGRNSCSPITQTLESNPRRKWDFRGSESDRRKAKDQATLERYRAAKAAADAKARAGATVYIMEVKPSLAELAHGAAALVEAIR